MEVVDRLTTIGARVYDEAIAVLEALGAGDFPGGGKQTTEQDGILRQGVCMGGNVALGNDENVHGGLRANVGEGQGVSIVVQPRDGDLTGDDLAEQAVRNGCFGLSFW